MQGACLRNQGCIFVATGAEGGEAKERRSSEPLLEAASLLCVTEGTAAPACSCETANPVPH